MIIRTVRTQKNEKDRFNVALLGRELIHTYQWAAAEKSFPMLSGLELARSVRETTTIDWKKGIKWTTWGPVSLMYGAFGTEVEDMVVLSYRAVPPLAPRADFAPLVQRARHARGGARTR